MAITADAAPGSAHMVLETSLGRLTVVRDGAALTGVIPCHRVIGAAGRLTGYAGGLDRKRALLEIEHARALRAGHAPAPGLW